MIRRLSEHAIWKRWAALLALSSVGAALLQVLHLPAGILLACMFAGIVLSSHDVDVPVPRMALIAAQGILGCLIARSLQSSLLLEVQKDGVLFVVLTSGMLLASAVLGWLMMRLRLFPGTTAIWGLAPGAASAMVVMAQDYGADMRLVAFMQYTRVAYVTVLASLVSHLWASGTAIPAVHVISSTAPAMVWWDVLATLFIATAGAWGAHRLRIPGGGLVVPLVLGMVMQKAGLAQIALPDVMLALAYATLGWSVGLRFTRPILLHAWRTLPMVLGAITALVVLGAIFAVCLHRMAGLEPLTAYLATSPGGADSVAIIAATSAVDAGFVMAMQMTRFFMVLVLGPALSRWVATRERFS
jgi:membrane AbrB-like protein